MDKMTEFQNQDNARLFIITRRDGNHVLGAGDERVLLTDDQLADLGRVAVARASEPASGETETVEGEVVGTTDHADGSTGYKLVRIEEDD